MAWADEAAQASQAANTLVVLTGKQVVETRTLVSSTHLGSNYLYSVAFSIAYPVMILPSQTPLIGIPVEIDEVGFTADEEWPFSDLTNMPVTRWAFDQNNGLIYYASVSPLSPSVPTYVYYELYFGSKDVHWTRRPLDATTREVYFEPAVITTPSITRGASSDAFGIVPTQGGTLSIEAASGLIVPHLRASSFSSAAIEVYSWLGAGIDSANIRRVFSGQALGYSYSRDRVEFRIADRVNLLDRTPLTGAADSIFGAEYRTSLGVIPLQDTLKQGVVGRKDGVEGIAQSFTDPEYSWEIAGRNVAYSLDRFVAASPASTTTRTYLDSVEGFDVDDSFYAADTGGPVTNTVGVVTAVNTGSNYIDHTALGTPLASGKIVRRAHISYVDLFQNGTAYRARYFQHYTTVNGGVTFVGTIQADLGLPNPVNNATTKVSGRVYGPKAPTTPGTRFLATIGATNHARTNTMANPVGFVFHALHAALNLTDAGPVSGNVQDYLDQQSFEDAYPLVTGAMGMAVPESIGETAPQTGRQMIERILESGFLRLYINEDGKFAISVRGLLPAPSRTIDETAIIEGSFNYTFDYQDMISDVTVRYNSQELGPGGVKSTSLVAGQNADSLYLHGISKNRSIDSLFVFEDEATEYATRVLDLFSRPSGQLRLTLPLEYSDLAINECVRVSVERIPGAPVLRGTDQTLDFMVSELTASRTGVTLVLDDQRGIEENSGDW